MFVLRCWLHLTEGRSQHPEGSYPSDPDQGKHSGHFPFCGKVSLSIAGQLLFFSFKSAGHCRVVGLASACICMHIWNNLIGKEVAFFERNSWTRGLSSFKNSELNYTSQCSTTFETDKDWPWFTRGFTPSPKVFLNYDGIMDMDSHVSAFDLLSNFNEFVLGFIITGNSMDVSILCLPHIQRAMSIKCLCFSDSRSKPFVC